MSEEAMPTAPTEIPNAPPADDPGQPPANQLPANPTGELPKWFFDENTPGTGEPPEYFNAKKYKTVVEQAKAQPELEKKLGSFAGAPESYDMSISEEARTAGFDIPEDDPFLTEYAAFAKEKNYSQENFSDSLNFYAQIRLSEQKEIENLRAQEKEKLGPRCDDRLADLKKYAEGNLPPEMVEGFAGMFATAGQVEAMEYIIRKNMGNMSPGPGLPPAGVTAADVEKMQFELDENKNRRIITDLAFRKKYEELAKRVLGTGPA